MPWPCLEHDQGGDPVQSINRMKNRNRIVKNGSEKIACPQVSFVEDPMAPDRRQHFLLERAAAWSTGKKFGVADLLDARATDLNSLANLYIHMTEDARKMFVVGPIDRIVAAARSCRAMSRELRCMATANNIAALS
jgi:hypothetical protein